MHFSCHSMAAVLTLVQRKQIRINIHKRNYTKHSKYKYTYYQNTHTYTHYNVQCDENDNSFRLKPMSKKLE